MIFKNFKEAHEYYNFEGSHRIGSFGNEKGITRSYSNGEKKDKILKDKILYVLKNDKVKDKFKLNIINKKKVRFFAKIKNGVEDMGLYKVKGFYRNYVIFIK
tara:strand:+ start:186 stop:491 length:306 start_codon:yes stop_codon:yes gene_type:complete